jgi:hypothetical protein
VFGSKQFFLTQPSERPYIDSFFLPALATATTFP